MGHNWQSAVRVPLLLYWQWPPVGLYHSYGRGRPAGLHISYQRTNGIEVRFEQRTTLWMFLDDDVEEFGDYQHLPCVKEAIEKAYVS